MARRITAEQRIIRSMSTNATRQAVLATEGLLETILRHMPVKKLFEIQRVCSRFRDAMAESPELRRKMFIQAPDTVSAEYWTVVGPVPTPGIYDKCRVVRFSYPGQLPVGQTIGTNGRT
ncbi:hypothetical protein LTR53_019780, partial [Teratosphaeriaceae sp. CCFEE 6253]